MSLVRTSPLGQWQARTTFILALSASAVGLGNLWRFSYLVGEYGGGPFVITYLLCLLLVAVPVMIAEVVIGSHGRGSPVAALRLAADRSMLSRNWGWLGVLACFTGLLLLAYFVVVAGWSLAYASQMQAGVFSSASVSLVGEQFQRLLANPLEMVYWQSLFLLVVVLIAGFGVRRGLGFVVWLIVPVLVVLLGVLVQYAFDVGDMEATRDFLFTVKRIDFTAESVLVALGHALFTLGVGVGTGISYGAYAPARIPIGRSVLAVALFDTMIAMLVGVAIFPLVFANNIEPSMGPGLMFVSLPYAFGHMIQGEMFGTLFFLLVVVAALGSAVAIFEPVVGALMQGLKLGRLTAAVLAGALVWGGSMAVAYSLGSTDDSAWYGNGYLFSLLDQLTADLLLPLVSLLIALLVGWRLRPEILRLELYRESALFVALWRGLLRFITPLAIIIIVLAAFAPGAAATG